MSYKGFSTVELRKPGRSTFNMSHEKRVSSVMGRLTPILCKEVMPNDTWYGQSEVLIKLAPMLAPIYHRVNCYVHYFFVPNRLLWQDWENFITGGRLGEAVTAAPQPPCTDIGYALSKNQNWFAQSSLFDYLGGQPISDGAFEDWDGKDIDLMPWAACYKIYMDYYRDRNYEADTQILPLRSGPYTDEPTYHALFDTRFRCWEHDYFTSALPFTQRGQEVLMPLAGSGIGVGTAAVEYNDQDYLGKIVGGVYSPGTTISQPLYSDLLDGAQFNNAAGGPGSQDIAIHNIKDDSIPVSVDVDIENSSVSINDLRRAVRLQEWLERNALAGSRYNESIMAHFGRRTSDSRLQRAEYLGGGKAVIQISEVLTTAFSEDSEAAVVPPGNMAGRGSAYANTNKFSYNAEEHGFIVAFLSVMPTSGYMQGMDRMFFARRSFLDYPWPSFAHLGEQPVYDYEIYGTPTTVPSQEPYAPPSVFGYQSRYSDWKSIQSSCHGEFRTTLNFWHLTRDFAPPTPPELGQSFVHFEKELQDRVFAVADSDVLWMYIYNKLNVNRSLPYFGTPML